MGKNHELAKEKIRQKGKKIITWLPGARYRVGHLMNNFKYTGKVRGSYKVYFILLNEYNKRPPMWGLYIGQTGKKIEDRYEQHLDPDCQLRSRKVTKRGTQILYSLCNLVPPMNKKDSLGVELLLLKSFRGESTEKLIRKLPKDIVRGG